MFIFKMKEGIKLNKRLFAFVSMVVMIFAITTLSSWAGPFDTQRSAEYEVGAWFPTVSGAVSAVDRISWKDDLAMQDQGSIVVGIKLNLSSTSNVQLQYASLNNSGSAALTQNRIFGNNLYRTNDAVTSTLRWSALDVDYEKNFSRTDEGELNWLIGVKALSATVTLNDSTRNFSDSFSLNQLVPQVGISGKLRVTENLIGYAKLLGMTGSAQNRNGSVVDIDAGFRYRFNPNWTAQGSYRWHRTAVTSNGSNNNTGEVQYGGPELLFRYEY